MPLWLPQLLEDPALGLDLIAGRRGLRSRGPVRWVHISEIPDPTPWLEGGEILLTTGLAVKDSPELQRKLVAGLDQRGCSGVGFGLGVWLDETPVALAEEAEARQLPLFTVPYEVPFIAITKRVSRAIADEHYATLRSAVELHRRMLAVVVGDGGVAGVLETMGRALGGLPCVAYDCYGGLLGAYDPDGAVGAIGSGALWAEVGPKSRDHSRFELAFEHHLVFGAAVRLGGQLEAVLVLLAEQPLLEHESLLLEQGVAGLSLELARGLSARATHRDRVDDLLRELDAGRIGHVDTARLLTRLGARPGEPFEVLCVTGSVSPDTLCGLVEDVIAPSPPIVGRLDGRVYCLAQPPEPELGDRLLEAARFRGWRDVAVGRSRDCPSADGLASALREATAAAAAAPPGTVRDVAELDVAGLFAGVANEAGLTAFVDRTLGPVLAHDATESTQLVNSLRAYLRHGCRPGPAAEELRVHRHTLAYRLDRVRDLTGKDPRDGRHLLEYGLALELLDREAPTRP
jgi:PucR family transcriptional regulator, purine catabolism regulatory protein